MCEGARTVRAVDDSLVIADPRATPDSERFLTAQANVVMKGVRHNQLSPFLQRLAKEGLWDLKASFGALDGTGQQHVLFGFWSRPGPGSFLKTPSADPSEMSSWLRWDGLYHHVLEQADRSPDTDWSRRLRESIQTMSCPRCGGSGLQLFAKLLQVGRLPFPTWTRLKDRGRMVKTISGIEVRTSRQKRSLQRIVGCVSTLATLRAETAPGALLGNAVRLFTTMTAADPGDVDVT
jgi:excinuclease UvrABC ATPase subunit